MEAALTQAEWKVPRLYFKDRHAEGVERGDPSTKVLGHMNTYGVELVVTPSTRDDPPLWVWDGSWAVEVPRDTRHALAALCLQGQPFGFTWEDVHHLRESLSSHSFVDLADRIEALLPPETT